jgi:lipoyl(octanoyl) transferase
LIQPARFPVFATGRGGRYTYHGPGQRVVYVMVDLDRRGRDLRKFVATLEEWVIAACARLGVTAFAVPGRVGVWVDTLGGEAKVAAIGVRVRRWVSFHGFAINVAPDLDHFGGIIPCGLPDFAVTSLRALGATAEMSDLDAELVNSFPEWLRNPPVAA